MSSKLARHIDHCSQHLCPSCPSLECSFFVGSKNKWAHERQMDCQPSFFFRQTVSQPLLHCLLAQQHQSSEHFCWGPQVASCQISHSATLYDGLPLRLGERAAVAMKHFTTKRRARMGTAHPRPPFGRAKCVKWRFFEKSGEQLNLFLSHYVSICRDPCGKRLIHTL